MQEKAATVVAASRTKRLTGFPRFPPIDEPVEPQYRLRFRNPKRGIDWMGATPVLLSTKMACKGVPFVPDENAPQGKSYRIGPVMASGG
jgi:hypothetical protein